MIEELGFTENKVMWNFNETEIMITLDNIISASEDLENKYISIEIGTDFIVQDMYYYSFLGELLLVYSIVDGSIKWYNDSKNVVKLSKLINVIYLPQKNYTLAIADPNTTIYVFDSNGNKLFMIDAPKGFKMQYFQEFSSYVSVVGQGGEEQADKFGRTIYNFRIDFYEKRLVMEELAY